MEKPKNLNDAKDYILETVMAEPSDNIEPAPTQEPALETPVEPPAEQPTTETAQEVPAPAPAQPETPSAEADPAAVATEAALRAAQELERTQQENAQLKAQLAQQSQAAETTINEELLEPPVLDMTNFAYLSDTEVKARQSDYANKMADFVAKKMDKQLKPVVDTVMTQKSQAEEQAVLSDLKAKAPDIDAAMPEIQALLQSDMPMAAALKQLPTRDRLVTAYAVVKGLQSLNPKQKTAEQIADEVYGNPDVMKNLELKKATALKQNKNVPAQAASSGMANIPTTVQKAATTWEEAEEMTRKRYGIEN